MLHPMEKNEEIAEKPKPNYRGIKAMPFIIGNETFEKIGTTGTLSNFLVYLTSVFHMKKITSTTLVNTFNGSANLATLIGAFLCDTYFGRYKTLAFASVASFLGMLIMTLTAAIKSLHPSHCPEAQDPLTCSGPTVLQMSILIIALALLVVGAGGIRPCNLAFGADQFNPETESGKRGIKSFFNWYYFTFTFAMMISLTIIVYVQSSISWALGLGIPAIMMLLSCLVFFMGSRIYVKVKPEGSPMTSIARVVVAAVKKRKLKQPDQPWISLFNYLPTNSIKSKLTYTDQFRCLDKAAIITPEDETNSKGLPTNPWRVCSLQEVEEVKCLLRVIPIWASALLYCVSQNQQQSYVVFQALQSNRRLGSTSFQIPAATYNVVTMISLTIWIPIYDRLVIPWLERVTKKEGGITLLQRMGVGLILSIVGTVLSAIVEVKRREFPITNRISSMSAMWLVPQLTIMGISEGFTVIAHIEFYYREFPENMRSIGGSLICAAFAVSSYLFSLLISVVHKLTKGAAAGDWLPEDLNRGRLDYFYYLIAALGVINFGYFLMCANWYKYKGSGSNSLEVGMKNMQPEKPSV